MPAALSYSGHWLLEPDVLFLNHGSFGACPRAVLQVQQQWRERLEREPVRFFVSELEPLLDTARDRLANLIGADPSLLAWVPNATAGVNAVLRSLPFHPGDELLTTDHEYNAGHNALEFVARRAGARVVVAQVPFPLHDPDQVIEAVLGAATPKTRLALLDHVTSQTGLILPVKRLVRELDARGIDTLIDGAHAPGMLPLNLGALDAAYYTGNCHKWLCSPKGAGFLWVRRDRQDRIRPLPISHGANSSRRDRSRFHLEFDWTGTFDPTPILSVGEAIRFMGSLLPGGWPELMAANRSRALAARRILCETLEISPPAPDAVIGALASLPLPDGPPAPRASALDQDPLQEALLARYRIQVPVIAWPEPPRRLIRISSQIYNQLDQYRVLARALAEILRRGPA
ncbi:MAG: aminotransferase class V-fold PLP-dependent enzyme [Acidobacteriota bacterium]